MDLKKALQHLIANAQQAMTAAQPLTSYSGLRLRGMTLRVTSSFDGYTAITCTGLDSRDGKFLIFSYETLSSRVVLSSSSPTSLAEKYLTKAFSLGRNKVLSSGLMYWFLTHRNPNNPFFSSNVVCTLMSKLSGIGTGMISGPSSLSSRPFSACKR